ncbi:MULTISPECIES: DUF6912 family protein [unclassified Brevibacterium]|uniref:DUF6912 family protein n=1 Tax=unclassified Brevibacterium TaxID=2614124 RepID=UPI0010918967|nr:hypothetical protein [Brevibacterium sp. S22]TGD33171.1 hypothetical protein EB835_01320 [Brevibacterium sp. S22]
MAIRCYIPTTLTALRSTLTDVRAVAPDAQGRSLRGEEFETAEFDAMCIAAALAANAEFDPAETDAVAEAAPERRVIVAYDAPESSPAELLTDGFELITLAEVDMTRVASFHLDEDVVWDEAVRLAEETGASGAEDHLGASDLLWYDSSELDQLLGDES